jgi:hypothetical protein
VPTALPADTRSAGAHASSELKLSSAVDTRDVELVQTMYRYIRASDAERKAGGLASEVTDLVRGRELADTRFRSIFARVRQSTPLVASSTTATADTSSYRYMQCGDRVMKSTEQQCGRFTSYSMKFQAKLVGFCATHSAEAIGAAAAHACSVQERPRGGEAH